MWLQCDHFKSISPGEKNVKSRLLNPVLLQLVFSALGSFLTAITRKFTLKRFVLDTKDAHCITTAPYKNASFEMATKVQRDKKMKRAAVRTPHHHHHPPIKLPCNSSDAKDGDSAQMDVNDRLQKL